MKITCRYCGREYDANVHGGRCPYDFSENPIQDSDMESKMEHEGGFDSDPTPPLYGPPRIKDNDPYERMQEKIPELLYGPPPIEDIYGPPPIRETDMIKDMKYKKEPIETLYGPPPPASSPGFFKRLLKKLGLK